MDGRENFRYLCPVRTGAGNCRRCRRPSEPADSIALNGAVMQNSNTNQMIFGVKEILAYISQVFTLEPGDLIYTGTPPGVGIARKPTPVWLKPDDVVEVDIGGLGVLKNPVVGE